MRGVQAFSEFLKLQSLLEIRGMWESTCFWGCCCVYFKGEILPLGTHLQDTPWDTPSLMCPLSCQMWTSVWRGLTTATLMLSARTPHGHTSASASLAIQGMVNIAKVRLGVCLEKGDLPECENQWHCSHLPYCALH